VMAGDLAVSTVTIWDLGLDGDAEWANLPSSGVAGAKFLNDGRRVVASSNGGKSVTIWDLQTGRALRKIGPTTDDFRIVSFAVNPDDGSVAAGGAIPDRRHGGKVARVWDTATGKELYRIGHDFDVKDVDFSPDGEHLFTVSYYGTGKIMDRSGRVIRVLQDLGRDDLSSSASVTHRREVEGAWFNPDGRLVATSFQPLRGLDGCASCIDSSGEPGRGRVRLWDWAEGEVVRTITSDVSTVWPKVDFDPKGPRIATAGPEGVEIRDLDSGRRVAFFAEQSGGVNQATFSPDGARIATAGDDGTVRVFEADTGAEQLVLRGSGCAVRDVAFSPDGSKLASTSCDGVRIWALDVGDLLDIAHQEVRRSLTNEECRQYLHVDQCPRAVGSKGP
jgi:WD40 repeat protein